MNNNSETRRICIFILFAFGIAWLTALVIAFNGGIANSPVVVPGLRSTLATVLIATIYIFAPTLANILTRVITHEGWGSSTREPCCHEWIFRIRQKIIFSSESDYCSK